MWKASTGDPKPARVIYCVTRHVRVALTKTPRMWLWLSPVPDFNHDKGERREHCGWPRCGLGGGSVRRLAAQVACMHARTHARQRLPPAYVGTKRTEGRVRSRPTRCVPNSAIFLFYFILSCSWREEILCCGVTAGSEEPCPRVMRQPSAWGGDRGSSHFFCLGLGDGSVVSKEQTQLASSFPKGNLLRHAETIMSWEFLCLILDHSQEHVVCIDASIEGRVCRMYELHTYFLAAREHDVEGCCC